MKSKMAAPKYCFSAYPLISLVSLNIGKWTIIRLIRTPEKGYCGLVNCLAAIFKMAATGMRK